MEKGWNVLEFGLDVNWRNEMNLNRKLTNKNNEL